MAVTYTTAAKNARMTGTRDHFADGTLEIGTVGMGSVLAVFGLSVTGGSVSAGAWTLAFDANSVAAALGGTAAAAQIKTSGGVADLTGLTVGVGSEDIVLDSDSITGGQTVTLNSAVITHAA